MVRNFLVLSCFEPQNKAQQQGSSQLFFGYHLVDTVEQDRTDSLSLDHPPFFFFFFFFFLILFCFVLKQKEGQKLAREFKEIILANIFLGQAINDRFNMSSFSGRRFVIYFKKSRFDFLNPNNQRKLVPSSSSSFFSRVRSWILGKSLFPC